MEEADRGSRRPGDRTPDLQTQLESLLDEVWTCEAGWRFEERLKLALSALPPRKPPRRPGRPAV
jgi:hypothetical protein